MTRQLFILLAVLMPLAGMAQSDPMVVRTESGLVKGIDQEGSVGFLGIPYAKVERFMPPKPVDKWQGVKVCDHWGPQAMQNTWGRKLSEAEMSEQCCVLNVWTTSSLNSKLSTFKVKARHAVASRRRIRFWHFGVESWHEAGSEGCCRGERQPSSEHPRLPRPLGL